MINNKLFAFTGGPGSGKTTLLNCLRNKGFQVVPEAAREIIKRRVHSGLPPRPEPIDFAIEIFNHDLHCYILSKEGNSPVFFDRSLVDSACMIYEADPAVYSSYESLINKNRLNPTVFLFPPWEEIYEQDDERDQSFADAVKISETLSNWYQSHGYIITEMPKISTEGRVEFILEFMTNNKVG